MPELIGAALRQRAIKKFNIDLQGCQGLDAGRVRVTIKVGGLTFREQVPETPGVCLLDQKLKVISRLARPTWYAHKGLHYGCHANLYKQALEPER